MAQQPKVSVCCLTYNHEAFIHSCLNGFLNQITDFSVEFLIHDDASTDNTKAILKSIVGDDPRFKLVLRKINIKSTGVHVFPLLYRMARGKYIALCEGDDYWSDPYKLQKQVDLLEEYSELSMTGHYCEVAINKELTPSANRLKEHIKIYSSNDFIQFGHFRTCTTVFRKKSLSLPDDYDKYIPGDLYLRLHLATKGKVAFHQEEMAVYNIHDQGMSRVFASDFLNSIKQTISIIERLDAESDNEFHDSFYKRIRNMMARRLVIAKVPLKAKASLVTYLLNKFGIKMTLMILVIGLKLWLSIQKKKLLF